MKLGLSALPPMTDAPLNMTGAVREEEGKVKEGDDNPPSPPVPKLGLTPCLLFIRFDERGDFVASETERETEAPDVGEPDKEVIGPVRAPECRMDKALEGGDTVEADGWEEA